MAWAVRQRGQLAQPREHLLLDVDAEDRALERKQVLVADLVHQLEHHVVVRVLQRPHVLRQVVVQLVVWWLALAALLGS